MINRKYLEQLMGFKRQAEIQVDCLEEEERVEQSSCQECGLSSYNEISARLREARSTLAYLTVLLDAYWNFHNKEETENND